MNVFDQYADDWWNQDHGPFRELHRINPLRMDFLRNQLGPLSGLDTLDVGCGGGILSQSLASQGANVCGLDISEKAIAAAKKHQASTCYLVDYRVGCLQAFSKHEPERYFDLVCLSEVLEHVDDPCKQVELAASRLKPGGYLMCSTINRNLISYALAIGMAEYALAMVPKGTHSYEAFIKPIELVRMAEGAGLSVQATSGMVFKPLQGVWCLDANNLQVNYLMLFRKSTAT